MKKIKNYYFAFLNALVFLFLKLIPSNKLNKGRILSFLEPADYTINIIEKPFEVIELKTQYEFNNMEVINQSYLVSDTEFIKEKLLHNLCDEIKKNNLMIFAEITDEQFRRKAMAKLLVAKRKC